MKWSTLLAGTVFGAIAVCAPVASAQGPHTDKPPVCEPGYHYVEELGYQEVEHHVCKEAPNMRTKWVYSSKRGYYCLPRICCHCTLDGSHPDHDASASDHDCHCCKGPYCRKILLKKKTECQRGCKCNAEAVKEFVPCPVWRKVPCDSTAPVPGQHIPQVLPPASSVSDPIIIETPK